MFMFFMGGGPHGGTPMPWWGYFLLLPLLIPLLTIGILMTVSAYKEAKLKASKAGDWVPFYLSIFYSCLCLFAVVAMFICGIVNR